MAQNLIYFRSRAPGTATRAAGLNRVRYDYFYPYYRDRALARPSA
jgi:hypothetical protein